MEQVLKSVRHLDDEDLSTREATSSCRILSDMGHLLTPQGAIKPYTLYRCIRWSPNDEIAPWSAGNVQLTLDLIIVFMSGLQIKLSIDVS